MSNKVNPIPAGYHSVTPYLIVKGALQALEFYKKAFNAKENFRMERPDKAGTKISHSEIQIGDSRIMVADECPEMGALSPRAPTGVSLYVYTENVDALTEQAVRAGAKLIHPVQDKFYGDRSSGLKDPFGHTWFLATHIEDVSEDEVKKRAADFMKSQAKC